MSADQGFGGALRRRRADAHMSLGVFAEMVHFDKGYISRVERGMRTPSLEFAKACDSVLGAGGELVALLPSGAPRNDNDVSDEPDDPLDELGEWWPVIRSEAGTDEASQLAARAFEETFIATRRLGQRTAPRYALATLGGLLAALRECAMSIDGATENCVLTAARCYELAGWMHQENGHVDRAVAVTIQARKLAGGTGLAAYTWVRQAELALASVDLRTTLRITARADEAPAATDRVRGLAAHRRAQAYALAGDARRCRDALRRAEEYLTADVPPEPGLVLGSAMVVDLCGVTAGLCYYELGQYEDAVASFEPAMRTISTSSLRTRGLYSAQLSAAYAGAGLVEQACDAGRAALAPLRSTSSASTHLHLRRLAKYLLRWRRHSEAQDLYVDMTSLLYPAIGER